MSYVEELAQRNNTFLGSQFPVTAPERFRIEISLSPGAAFNPTTSPPGPNHTLPTVPRMQLNLGESVFSALA